METFSNRLCLQRRGDSWRRFRRWHLQPSPRPWSLPDAGSSPWQRPRPRRAFRGWLRQETCWHWHQPRLWTVPHAQPLRTHRHCGRPHTPPCPHDSPQELFHLHPVHRRTRGAGQLHRPRVPRDHPAPRQPQGAPTGRCRLGRERPPGAVGRDGEKGQVLPAEWGSRFRGEGGGGGVWRGRGWWGRGRPAGGSLVGQAEAGSVSGVFQGWGEPWRSCLGQ